VAAFTSGSFGKTLYGEIENLPHQEIGSRFKAFFALNNGGNGVLEGVALHDEK
jgi:hypothetical protein